jgi:hypothetical protein
MTNMLNSPSFVGMSSEYNNMPYSSYGGANSSSDFLNFSANTRVVAPPPVFKTGGTSYQDAICLDSDSD